jgi:SAM-dependent methyltransferase
MIIEDVKYLKCIKCGKDLKLDAITKSGKKCISGILKCTKCKVEWPVINGIPRLLPDELLAELVYPMHKDFFEKNKIKLNAAKDKNKLKNDTAESFGFEWLKYPKILSQFEKDWKRYFNPQITKEQIKNKIVADYGCGMAKHGYFIGKYKAKKYIGIDLSEAVEAAYKNTENFNSLIVQADIYHLPLKGELIDLHYSIGVLHHLPDPEKGFLSITKIMKKDARIFIWVYGKKNNKRALYFYNPIRTVTTKIPKKILYALCHIPASALHGLNLVHKGLNKIGMKKLADKVPLNYYSNFPYSFKVSDSFDVFATPKQLYYENFEIENWYKHAKLRKIIILEDKYQGIKAYGTK